MEPVENGLSIVVVGASGDLARRKIFPALFALYCQNLLPDDFHIFGFARSAFDHEAFRARVEERLTCRYVPGESCAERMREFLGRCYYAQGGYESRESFLDLYDLMRQTESGPDVNRMFYLAIPPSIFLDVAHAIGGAGLVSCGETHPWSRVVIEKPFGRDRASSDRLVSEMGGVFLEPQTYRIDHYLGKEVIQNLMVLRFANLVFEPVWSRRHIEHVQIAWQEKLGVEGRGGYFDSYGIIRDVMQNHLLQILALVAMEPPAVLDATCVRTAKVDALRSVHPLTLEDVVIGQYMSATAEGRVMPGYRDDESVPDGSLTPTFCAAVLRVNNPRWEGVPFLISAGKGMDVGMNEIRIRFRRVEGDMFCRHGVCPEPNELVIRVQPDEGIDLKITSKVPGLGMELQSRKLDLQYKAAFSEEIPDAYESLLLDVIRGEKSLFISSQELAAAWDIFTPLLHDIDGRAVAPEPYAFGSRGPVAAEELARKLGIDRM